jgi:hypothetical protein
MLKYPVIVYIVFKEIKVTYRICRFTLHNPSQAVSLNKNSSEEFRLLGCSPCGSCKKTAFFINLKSYIALTGWAVERRRNVSPVRYKLGSYFPEDGTLHSHRRETSYLTRTLLPWEEEE